MKAAVKTVIKSRTTISDKGIEENKMNKSVTFVYFVTFWSLNHL